MKTLLLGMATILICSYFQVFQFDYNMHQLHLNELKIYTEAAAAAAAQYKDNEEYSHGVFKFNRTEGIKAAEYILKKTLNLNEDFSQKSGNYWVNTVSYTIQFFDDTNTEYNNYTYTDSQSGFSSLITAPTVIISVNCGRARYRLPYISLIPESRRITAHEWVAR